MEANEVIQNLDNFPIDTSSWGTGGAKTVEHLQEEIECGESALVRQGDQIFRKLTVSTAKVFFHHPGGRKLRLVETKQVFKDGRERRRDMRWAVAEKLKVGEDPREVIERGIREELGIEKEIEIITNEVIYEDEESRSYPGLEAHYELHLFDVYLTEAQYVEDGYVEHQDDKSSFFEWVEM